MLKNCMLIYMTYLKEKQHYSDLYDRHTVDLCRKTEELFKEDVEIPKGKKVDKEELKRAHKVAHKLYLYFQKGERYLNKESIIKEWMDRDQKKDDLYENAQAPEDIRCLTCRNKLKSTFKDLWSETDKEDCVLFMYDCPNKCLPRRAFFNDGEEWRVKPNLCPRCDVELNKKADDDGTKLTTTYTCSKCKYTETDVIEWSETKEDGFDENFARDRERYCLTDEEGQKFQREKWNMEQMGKLAKEFEEKEQARAEKLEQNPKGFHLDGAGYTCFICGGSTPEGDNWYDKYGIKCLVCQRAIDKKEIPASLAKNKDSWYSKFDLEHYFNLKGPALRKWVKEGIIKSRTVSRYGEGVHVELFLIKDNKGFLPPKKMVESQMVREKKDGEVWTHSEPWYRFVDPFEYLKGYKIMDYMRVVPPEELKKREEEKAKKREAKRKKSKKK